MRSPVAAAIAIGLGLIVLFGYFVPPDAASPALSGLLNLRTLFIDWATTLAAFASLVAIFGLLLAHGRKLRARRNPDHYSVFTLVGFLAVFVFGIVAYTVTGDVRGYQQIVNAVQVPIETSLMAVLAVTLTVALLRLFQRRTGLLAVVFAASVLVFLFLNSGILASLDSIDSIVVLLAGLQILPVAGARGILLGIALGSIIAGLRILLAVERPYSG